MGNNETVIETVMETEEVVKFPWKKLGGAGLVAVGLAAAGIATYKFIQRKRYGKDVEFVADEETDDFNEVVEESK